MSIPVADGDGYDLGGQWIGPGQPLVLSLVSELGIMLVRQPWFEDDEGNGGEGSRKAGGNGAYGEEGGEVGARSMAFHSDAAVAGCGVSLVSSPCPGSLSSGASLSLSSGSSIGGLNGFSERDATELSCLIAKLDGMAATVRGPPWGEGCPEAAEWDQVNAREWLEANVQSEGVMREMVRGGIAASQGATMQYGGRAVGDAKVDSWAHGIGRCACITKAGSTSSWVCCVGLCLHG